ncbi:MAG: ABC transporter ATP-binding protein [Bacillota bacterium]
MENKNTILEIKNLSVSYNSGQQLTKAVNNISLKIKKGSSVGLIGESGSGKSSVLLSIMGLLKKAEISGEIFYQNKNLLDLKAKELLSYRWQKIALVFQNSLAVFNPVLTIKEQLEEVIKRHCIYSENQLEQKIDKLLGQVRLAAKWKNYYPHQLSGGMRQKVLIAMALACKPEILLVDEPTTALDPANKKEIIALLNHLKQKYNLTMLVVSHSMETIKKLSSKLITMYQGDFVEIGSTAEVIAKPEHCYTRGLLNSSPALFPYKDLWGIKSQEIDQKTKGCSFYSRCPQHLEKCKEIKPKLKYTGVEHRVACNRGGIVKLLEAFNLAKTYNNQQGDQIKAVNKVNLNIRSGEILVLVGNSGSGKSSLAQLLAGIEKADQGKINFRGQEISQIKPTAQRKGIQMIFQDPFAATSDRLSILEVILEPLTILNWKTKKQRKKKAVQLLKKLQLPIQEEFLNRACKNLSGGQRQRIAIARALITEPSLLIADEITSMLDPSIQANIIRKLKELQNQNGFSMIYITHNLALAKKIADKVYLMEKGKIIKKGSAAEIFKKTDKHQAAIYSNII